MLSRGYRHGLLLVFALITLPSIAWSAEESVEDNLERSLVGLWQLRIDAGGEIYQGKFQLSFRDGKLGGTYESDEGRRTRMPRSAARKISFALRLGRNDFPCQ